MLEKKVLLGISFLVFTGILISLISCLSTEETSTQEAQPKLYSLEDALTLAVQTLQAEPRVVNLSKTPTPGYLSDTQALGLTEQSESEDNAGGTVSSTSEDNADETDSLAAEDDSGDTDLSMLGDNGEETDPPDGNNQGDETDGDTGEDVTGEGDADSRLAGKVIEETVDPTKIDKPIVFPPGETPNCSTWLCGPRKGPILARIFNSNNLVNPIPPPAIVDNRCGNSKNCNEKSDKPDKPDKSTDDTDEAPPGGREIPPIPIDPPGLPPLPPIQPPIFP